jgi:uncharacterized membrane protein YqjE
VDYRGHTSAAPDLRSPAGDAESDGRSIGDVLRDIGSSIQDIVRWEIKLAKIEVADSARRVRSSSMLLATGGLFGIYALGFLLLGALFALEIVLPAWLAALILGALLSIGASAGIAAGRKRLKAVQGPHKTMQTVKEDLQWMKEQARS